MRKREFQLEEEEQPKGSVRIDFSPNLAQAPSVEITGEVTHREILSIMQFVIKAFRKYINDQRAAGLKKEESENE